MSWNYSMIPRLLFVTFAYLFSNGLMKLVTPAGKTCTAGCSWRPARGARGTSSERNPLVQALPGTMGDGKYRRFCLKIDHIFCEKCNKDFFVKLHLLAHL